MALDITSYVIGKKSAPSPTGDWSDIGYSDEPSKIVEELHNNALNIKNAWNNSTQQMSSFKTSFGSNNLRIFPLIDTSNVIGWSGAFQNCFSLIELPALTIIPNSSNKKLENMFYNCTSLTSVNFSNADISLVENMSNMFYNCSNLKILDLSSFNTNNLKNTYNMFASCINLTSINFGNNFNTSKLTNMQNMFDGCTKLDNETLNNILLLCIGANTSTKNLQYIGINDSFVNYANITNLSNYEAFTEAGWTLTY